MRLHRAASLHRRLLIILSQLTEVSLCLWAVMLDCIDCLIGVCTDFLLSPRRETGIWMWNPLKKPPCQWQPQRAERLDRTRLCLTFLSSSWSEPAAPFAEVVLCNPLPCFYWDSKMPGIVRQCMILVLLQPHSRWCLAAVNVKLAPYVVDQWQCGSIKVMWEELSRSKGVGKPVGLDQQVRQDQGDRFFDEPRN